MTNKKKKFKVIELFAGVGGFHVGLDRASKRSRKGKFETVWVNQWEPATPKNQHAAAVYQETFHDSKHPFKLCAEDIWEMVGKDDAFSKRINEIPDHDILTGGFPCQDYSVARPLSHAIGLEGKKGVLWWSIYKILLKKSQDKKVVPYIFLENVDRLIKSPANKRGRDFAIMLSSLSQLGYIVEWRVINAADYGFPQRRRRTFIFGYHKSSDLAKEIFSKGRGRGFEHKVLVDWVHKNGVLAKAFPIKEASISGSFEIGEDPFEITRNFIPEATDGLVDKASPFQNSGIMVDLHIYTSKVKPYYSGKLTTLGDIINGTNEKDVPEKYYIKPELVKKWEEQKSAHDFERTSKTGHVYRYKEGAIPFPDSLDRASRTIITSEGGSSPSRFKHVVDITKKKGWKNGREIEGIKYKYRRLIPEELEALCMFDREHTKYMRDQKKNELVEVSDNKRAFFMGNALVVGVIQKIGEELLRRV